jgi:hypothetical protein
VYTSFISTIKLNRLEKGSLFRVLAYILSIYKKRNRLKSLIISGYENNAIGHSDPAGARTQDPSAKRNALPLAYQF